jgi:hypothetical protein
MKLSEEETAQRDVSLISEQSGNVHFEISSNKPNSGYSSCSSTDSLEPEELSSQSLLSSAELLLARCTNLFDLVERMFKSISKSNNLSPSTSSSLSSSFVSSPSQSEESPVTNTSKSSQPTLKSNQNEVIISTKAKPVPHALREPIPGLSKYRSLVKAEKKFLEKVTRNQLF